MSLMLIKKGVKSLHDSFAYLELLKSFLRPPPRNGSW